MTYPSAPPTGGDQLTAILDKELIDATTPTGGPLGAGKMAKHTNQCILYYLRNQLTFNDNGLCVLLTSTRDHGIVTFHCSDSEVVLVHIVSFH